MGPSPHHRPRPHVLLRPVPHPAPLPLSADLLVQPCSQRGCGSGLSCLTPRYEHKTLNRQLLLTTFPRISQLSTASCTTARPHARHALCLTTWLHMHSCAHLHVVAVGRFTGNCGGLLTKRNCSLSPITWHSPYLLELPTNLRNKTVTD